MKIEAEFSQTVTWLKLFEGELSSITQEKSEDPAKPIKSPHHKDELSDSDIVFCTIKQNAHSIEMFIRENGLEEKDKNSFSAQLKVLDAKSYSWLLPKNLSCDSKEHAGVFSTKGKIFERFFCEVPFAIMHYTNAGETCEAENWKAGPIPPFDPYNNSNCKCPNKPSDHCSIL